MSELEENSLILRKARKSGGSVIITLTDFIKENQWYNVSNSNEIVTLTPIKMDTYKTEL